MGMEISPRRERGRGPGPSPHVVSWEPSAEHFQEEGGSGRPGQVLPRGQACTLAAELWHRVCAVTGVPRAPVLRLSRRTVVQPHRLSG